MPSDISGPFTSRYGDPGEFSSDMSEDLPEGGFPAGLGEGGFPASLDDGFDDVLSTSDDEGPIFICGLDDVLTRLEHSGGVRAGGDSGSTLEDLGILLTDAGFSR